MATQTVRTTFALPADLLAAVDQAVQAGQARSRNEWVARALQRELAAQQRAAIDAAFAAMADDPAYHTEAHVLTNAFAQADWEALRLAEGRPRRRGEVYDARLDPTRLEQVGIRPMVIVGREANNAASPVILVGPCTTYRAGRRLYPSPVLLHAPDGGLDVDSVALGEQVRALATSRLGPPAGPDLDTVLTQLDHALLIALDLLEPPKRWPLWSMAGHVGRYLALKTVTGVVLSRVKKDVDNLTMPHRGITRSVSIRKESQTTVFSCQRSVPARSTSTSS